MYVDDILLIASNPTEIQLLKQYLDSTFGIKDLGQLYYFLGFEVSHNLDGITLTQRKFTQDLLRDSDFLTAKATATPLPVNLKLTVEVRLPDPTTYRTYVGKLNFLCNTKPDTLQQFGVLAAFI